MKYILVLGFIILSTFVCSNKCYQTIGGSIKEDQVLIDVLTKLADSKVGPSWKLVKIYEVEKQMIPEENIEMYRYEAHLKTDIDLEQICVVLVKIDYLEKGGYFVTFMCPREIISRLLKASGKVEEAEEVEEY